MKVLLITDNYILEHVNGTYYHRCIDEHINAYRSLGDIRLCLPVANTISIKREVDLTGISVCKIDKENNIYKRFINRSYNKRVIEREVKNADIIVGFVPSSVCDLALRYAKKYHKLFLSVVIASAWDILWYHSLKGKFIAPINHVNTKRTIRRSDYVVYVTDRYLQSKYPTDGVSIGVSDVALEEVDKQILNNKLTFFNEKEDMKKLNLMSIGAVDVRYKGHADVVQAMAVLAEKGYDIDYWLIGGGSDEYIKDQAAKFGVETKVHVLGVLPHEEIFNKFGSIDIYVQPSHTEGMPRAVIEAMSRAVPVICSNAGGMPELISERCIYHNGSIEGLVEKIITMTSTTEILNEEAKRNFDKSMEFQPYKLKEKRDCFLQKIMSDHEL